MFSRVVKNDEYYTKKESWADIAQYLPRDKVIWECFYSHNSKSAIYLRELGFEVIFEPVDFFESNLGEIIVSNPPFSMKKEVFTRLKELDKPFVMLVPSGTIQTKYFKELFENDNNIQLIVPWKKRQFDSPIYNLHPRGCSFNTLYVCYKMNLPKDVILL